MATGRGTSPSPSPAASGTDPDPASLAQLPDERLLEAVQQQCFRLFREGAHPTSCLAPDRRSRREDSPGLRQGDDLAAIGGSGFGIMAYIVAVERGWISRAEAVER